MPIRLVYESACLVAWEKPAGLDSTFRSPGDSESATAVSLAADAFPELRLLRTSPHEGECGLLHRLDRGTSGLLLFARTQAAYDALKRVWKTDAVEKRYLALVTSRSPPEKGDGKGPLPETEIRLPIAHDAKSSRKMTVVDPELREKRHRGEPRAAHTRIESVRRVNLPGLSIPVWEVQIRIYTGLRHQIRAHLSQAGFPILGDTLYRGTHFSLFETPDTFALASSQIKITLPFPGLEKVDIQIPPPWKSLLK